MQRTHMFKHDLDWLPPSYRAIRWLVAGGLWTGLAGGVAVLSIISHVHFFVFGKGIAVLAAGGYVAGDKAARSVLRSRLRKLAHGAVDLSRLPAESDGELVHVTGKVRALGGPRQVFRRAVFSFDGQTRIVHETAQDFWLVGDGEPVLVEVAEARLLADGDAKALATDDPRVEELEQLALAVMPRPTGLDRTLEHRQRRRVKGKKLGKVRLAEIAVADGDEIEIVGYKSRTIDPTVATRLERETPFRATLKGGRNLPLLIAPRPA
jgi:hypothetical protein